MRKRAKNWPWETAHRTGEAIRRYREHLIDALTSEEAALRAAEAKAHDEDDPEEDAVRDADPGWLAHIRNEGRKLATTIRQTAIRDLVAQFKSRPAPSPRRRRSIIDKLVKAIDSDQSLSLLAWTEAFGKERGNKTKKPRRRSPKATAANPWAAYDASQVLMEIADESILPIHARIRQYKFDQGIPKRYDWLPVRTDMEIAVDYWFALSSASSGEQNSEMDEEFRADLITTSLKSIRVRGNAKRRGR